MLVRLLIFWLLARIKIMEKLKLIKYVVFILTFLLVFGSLVLLGTIFKKVRGGDEAKDMPLLVSLQEPDGSSIEAVVSHGDNLYLLIKNGGKDDRVVIFNPQEAQKISEISLN